MCAAKKKNEKKDKDRIIVEKFSSGECRLIQERNDFFLPQALAFIDQQTWNALIPEYQRRPVWNDKKKSLFIESLIMNVPIPPIFLFEHKLGQYEIMDGQQRMLAIGEFYDGKYALKGLEAWPELNGRKFKELPDDIVKGLARRRISATMIINETISLGSKKWNPIDIRREVFSRLNSGGVNLSVQELRNSLYSGAFNSALIRLAALDEFTTSWGIPKYTTDKKPHELPEDVKTNTYFKRMLDCEFVLRFFTLRKKTHAKGSIKAAMDNFMKAMLKAPDSEIQSLASTFTNSLKISRYIFGSRNFSIKNDKGKWTPAVQAYDAIMLAIDHAQLDFSKKKPAWKKIGQDYETLFLEDGFREELIERRTSFASVKRHRKLIAPLIERHL